MIGVIDYGLGNVRAILAAYESMGISARALAVPNELDEASKLILPGVGSFDHAFECLDRGGFSPVIRELVEDKNVPILGICLGMQLLASASEEGSRPGFGWIEGRARSLKSLAGMSQLPVPHMGWNSVHPLDECGLFQGINQGRFYFLHSYFFDCTHRRDVLAEATYGGDFACAIQRGHIVGVQFHPEKSHHFGERMLANFASA
jgi:glutamine amidotransferase